jgi:hypothetical protein
MPGCFRYRPLAPPGDALQASLRLAAAKRIDLFYLNEHQTRTAHCVECTEHWCTPMSVDSRSSSFDFIVQMSCLVLLCSAVGVLYYTMQRQPQRIPITTVAITRPVVNQPVPTPTAPVVTPIAKHSKPPELPTEAISMLTILTKDRVEHSVTGFLVRNAVQQPVLCTIASQLSRHNWENIKNLTGSIASLQGLKPKPVWIGPITRDNHPNMLNKPDLSNDLIVWKVPEKKTTPTLRLAKELVKVNTPVWILSLPVEKPLRWLKGYVIDATENIIQVKPQERFDGDKLIGTIIVNEAGEIVSLSMGGDFLLIGSSSVGILKKLNETVPTR